MGGTLQGGGRDDVSTRLRYMDKEGIDVAVFFPTASLRLNKVIELDYAVSYCRAFNNYMADICKQSPRVKGVALLPFQDVEEAVKEADRAVEELGLTAIAVATGGMREHLGSRTYWPIYDKIRRLNVPLCVHCRHEPPGNDERFDSFIFLHTVGRPLETFVQFAGLIYGGVPETFPDLRIGFFECGVGWVPYWIERMDEEWEARGKVESPLCKKKPSEYIKHGNWYFATEAEESLLPVFIDQFGADKVFVGSDYGHWDRHLDAFSIIQRRQDLSPQSKEKILGENAQRLYGWL
jgi:predicted TIM-barrel fold metal-dependent hydrolase